MRAEYGERPARKPCELCFDQGQLLAVPPVGAPGRDRSPPRRANGRQGSTIHDRAAAPALPTGGGGHRQEGLHQDQRLFGRREEERDDPVGRRGEGGAGILHRADAARNEGCRGIGCCARRSSDRCVTAYVYPDGKWEETLKIVDATSPYALTGAVFARDRAAVRQALDGLRHAAGNFYINDKPTGAVVGQQPFGGARGSGTNDKAGSKLNLVRWASARTVKETLAPPRTTRIRSCRRNRGHRGSSLMTRSSIVRSSNSVSRTRSPSEASFAARTRSSRSSGRTREANATATYLALAKRPQAEFAVRGCARLGRRLGDGVAVGAQQPDECAHRPGEVVDDAARDRRAAVAEHHLQRRRPIASRVVNRLVDDLVSTIANLFHVPAKRDVGKSQRAPAEDAGERERPIRHA